MKYKNTINRVKPTQKCIKRLYSVKVCGKNKVQNLRDESWVKFTGEKGGQ